MKFEKIRIKSSKITGLEHKPYWFKYSDSWLFDISFWPTNPYSTKDIACIKAGTTEEKANEFYDQIVKNFEKASIREGYKVNILLDEDGNVIAVGSTLKNNSWIDMRDNCNEKNFKDLDLKIDSLEILW